MSTHLWHVILNSNDLVLAVYGEALESEALAKLNEIAASTNAIVRKTTIITNGKRPKVGEQI